MTRKYYSHTQYTNPRHHEEEPQNNNNHKTPGRQTKQRNQLSLPHQDDCKNRKDIKQCTTNMEQTHVACVDGYGVCKKERKQHLL